MDGFIIELYQQNKKISEKALEISSSILDVGGGEKQKLFIKKYFCLFMVFICGLSTISKK